MGRRIINFTFVLLTMLCASCHKQHSVVVRTDENGFKYESVVGDIFNSRLYTLRNGMRVMLSENHEEPRIKSHISVNSGSINDPDDYQGLFYSMMHVMGKGSAQLGTLNWEKEEPILNQIAQKYEAYRSETDAEKRRNIYHQIDSLSGEAAKYSVLDEYNKLVSGLGAKDIQSATAEDLMLFTIDIPSNELERWLLIESERLFNMVPRYFHTEMEVVYEGYNKSLNRSTVNLLRALKRKVLQNTRYGRGLTLGNPEHLKNPSIDSIMSYYKHYFVPHNMLMCLQGDFKCDDAILLIDRYFGSVPRVESIEKTEEKYANVEQRFDTVVYDHGKPMVAIGYLGQNVTDDHLFMMILNGMLCNGQIGLLDDLKSNHQLLNVGVRNRYNSLAHVLCIIGEPKNDQSLPEVRDMILAEVEKICNDNFDDFLFEGAKNFSKKKINNELHDDYVGEVVFSLAWGYTWQQYLSKIERINTITRKEFVDFANQHLKNPTIFLKYHGVDSSAHKIEKPEITSISTQTDQQSNFYSTVNNYINQPISPVFVDYRQAIKTTKLANDIYFDYVEADVADPFSINYVIEYGSSNCKYLSMLAKHITNFATTDYTASELRKNMFRYGLDLSINVQPTITIITMSGLEDNLVEAIDHVEHFISKVVVDSALLAGQIELEKATRRNNKVDIDSIAAALERYATYENKSLRQCHFTDYELDNLTVSDAIEQIRNICNYPHRVYYYGHRQFNDVLDIVRKHHRLPITTLKPQLKNLPKERRHPQSKVYFVDLPGATQVSVGLTAIDDLPDAEQYAYSSIFNDIYDLGQTSMASLAVRETRSLSHSVKMSMQMPSSLNNRIRLTAQLFTQPDKVVDAIDVLHKLATIEPSDSDLFESRRDMILHHIETERIIPPKLYRSWYHSEILYNIDFDARQVKYNLARSITFNQFKHYFRTHVAQHPQSILLVGNKKNLDLKSLEQFGKVEEVSVEDVIGY
ncbi:MAG: insulinase family protein [Salinivirgaceae bacterium]|nr:insulinase family protein [Salinivirgaceae bacterium]